MNKLTLEEFEQKDTHYKERYIARFNEGYWINHWIKIGVTIIVVVILALLVGCPYYSVWQQQQSGKAELAKAQYSKQAAVAQAKAKSESATYEAQAEIIRAKGVQKSNKIIADGLGGPEGYLTYLKIQSMSNDTCEKVYIPTEAMLPITESAPKTNN